MNYIEERNIAAVICEYNPFHNGHKFHISETRKLYGATHIIAIMSGCFVQRGDCAVYPKQTRARAALMCGADMVIELPLPWSMATAEHFARGGVSLAASLGCVDMLSFGSESGDIAALTAAADALEDGRVYERSRELQKSGATFAAARSQAVGELFGAEVNDILCQPNDTLAIEYLRALRELDSSISPVCVKRGGAAHDGAAVGNIASASMLRERIRTASSSLPDDVTEYVPEQCREVYINTQFADISYIERAALMRLRLMSREQLAALPDISEGLENRIYDAAGSAVSLDDLFEKIKCKRYTLARIRRVVLSALLDIPAGLERSLPPYIRVLGVNTKGSELLRELCPTVPVVIGYADANRLTGEAALVYELNRRANETFAMCCSEPLARGSDFAGGFIKITD